MFTLSRWLESRLLDYVEKWWQLQLRESAAHSVILTSLQNGQGALVVGQQEINRNLVALTEAVNKLPAAPGVTAEMIAAIKAQIVNANAIAPDVP